MQPVIERSNFLTGLRLPHRVKVVPMPKDADWHNQFMRIDFSKCPVID